MAYTALYRKWRPETFEDVKGQEAIVTTLRNQIASGRIGHAYLFCGTRGTGKTTVAKIFARAVNCENPRGGDPCGVCDSCRTIAEGSSMNVAEIDAASNNGVDNIREIREEVQYSPAEGKYRVYIIDEAHMLSAGAFNALLKTLEEPPSYVIFILATTEPQKIPITVLSRCQRYDFKRITTEVLTDRLRELAARENVEIEEKALSFLARKADGAMRDAISLLDQCIAFHLHEKLTYDKVLAVLGSVDNEVFSRYFRSSASGNTTACLMQIEKIVMSGRELGQFVQVFIWYVRSLLLLKTSEAGSEILDLSREDWERMAEESSMMDPDGLMRLIRIYSELANQMRNAVNKRVLLEITAIRTTRPAMENDLSSLLARVSALEKKAEAGALSVPQQPAAKPQPEAEAKPEARKTEMPLPRAQYEELTELRSEWPAVLKGIEHLAALSLEGTRVEPRRDGVLCVVFSDSLKLNMCRTVGALDQVRDYVRTRLGRELELDSRLAQVKEQEVVYICEEDLAPFHTEIEIEED